MTDAQRLGVVRAYVFGVAAAYVMLVPLERFAQFPLEVYSPMGVARLVPDALWRLLHAPTALVALQWIVTAGLLASAAGVGAYRIIAPASAILFILHQSIVRVDVSGHRELALLYCVLLLAVLPAADGWSVRSRERHEAPDSARHRAGLYLIGFGFLFTYAAPGIYRLTHAAPAIFWDNSMRHYVLANGGPMRNGTFGFDYGIDLVTQHPGFATVLNLGLLLATLLEALAPVALVNRAFRYGWLGFCLSFHLGNLLALNIDFILNMLLASILLTVGAPRSLAPASARAPIAG